jgi:drug/metabolite transporter (DMT)-like permease
VPSSHRRSYAGPLIVLAGATGFSFKAIFVKAAYALGVDATTLLALRLLFALPAFLLMGLWARGSGEPLTRGDWLAVIGLGFVGYYLSSTLDFLGLLFIPAGLERLILFLTPTLVVLMSAALFKTPIRRHHIISLALSYGGMALVFVSTLRLSQTPNDVLLGGGLVFASAIAFATYMIGSGRVIPRMGTTRFTAYASTIACVFGIVQFLIINPVSAMVQPAELYWLVLAMAAVSTVAPIWLMAEGMRRIGSNQTSMISAIGPVMTIFFGWLLLGEAVTLVQIIGSALVLAGVLLVSLKVEAAKSS